jgi:hypothetical protein
MLSAAKHLAPLFLGGKFQSEILRSALLRSELVTFLEWRL